MYKVKRVDRRIIEGDGWGVTIAQAIHGDGYRQPPEDVLKLMNLLLQHGPDLLYALRPFAAAGQQLLDNARDLTDPDAPPPTLSGSYDPLFTAEQFTAAMDAIRPFLA